MPIERKKFKGLICGMQNNNILHYLGSFDHSLAQEISTLTQAEIQSAFKHLSNAVFNRITVIFFDDHRFPQSV